MISEIIREDEQLLSEGNEHRSAWQVISLLQDERLSRIRQTAFLALNVMLLLASILLNTGILLQASNDSLSTGLRTTDMEDARSYIAYEERMYTGVLEYDPEQHIVVRKQDADVEYFGPPNKDIDNAWAQLLHGEFPSMTPQEAEMYQPELRRIPATGNFHFEPDMFHSLHCINAIRIALSGTLYNVSKTTQETWLLSRLPEGWEAVHIEHCMDRLRQAVMCFGDLTPSPLYSWDGFILALGKSGKHTCRKWQPIRNWMDERGKKGPVLGPD